MIPGVSNPLPPEVTQLIEQSVATFESKFQGFGMLTLARAQGWIEEFRQELVAIAVAARVGK